MTSKLIVLACILAVANGRSFENVDFSTLSNRLKGARDAKPGEFPHQVSIEVDWPEENYFSYHYCSGSILSNQWILTSAFCLVDIERAPPGPIISVKAGKHHLNETESTEQISTIDKLFIHELYDKKAPLKVIGSYNVGLIKLKNPFQLNERVATISLPKQGSDPTGKVTLSGWGIVDRIPSEPWKILQTIDVQIVNRETCNQAVQKTTEAEHSEDLINETHICSGFTNDCVPHSVGEPGTPLIKKNIDGKAEIVGTVLLWFPACSEKYGAPTVYTRTSLFVSWIEKIIANN